ncbi:uncharacterized protein isoform X2 [Leptinotarsa decemlineata]|uniref:uncharacterized protein isoform X2 n=1 Tax=Leptinotarsa decemlineata TaxID=7539 RepID=UPI003D3076C0
MEDKNKIDVGDFFSKLICHKCLNIVKYVQRVQKQFQTNQYILRERICPKDYDVEFESTSTLLLESVTNLTSLAESSKSAGTAALSGEKLKRKKYQNLGNNYLFHPVAIETFGGYGPEALLFIHELGRRIGQATKDHHSTSFLIERISIAIQRGNAASVLGTIPPSHNFDEIMHCPNFSTELKSLRNKPRYVDIHQSPIKSANATKDVSTSTDHEPANDRLSLSMSTLFMLNRPYVSVEKLEESDISKYWKKIGKSTYRIRKQSGLKEMVSGEVAAVQRISVPIDVFSSFPSLEIPKADDIYGLEGYEKINDTLYKELPKQSQLTAEERENNSEKQAHCDMISVPTNTFDLFSSPYVEVSRIDQIFREEGFKKIGEFIYKKIPSSLGKPIIERDSSNKKQYNCQPPSNKQNDNYYYNLPTSALKELIQDRHQEMNGEKESQQEIDGDKKQRLIQKPTSKGKNPSLPKVDESVTIEVCKHCNQNFKTKELLTLHYSIRHNKSNIFSNIKTQAKTESLRKPLLNGISQIETKFRAKGGRGIPSTNNTMKRKRSMKLNKRSSNFERLNSDRNFSRKSRELHFKKKWMSTNQHSFENKIQEAPNIKPSLKIPTESYLYQEEERIWFAEAMGSDNVDSDDNNSNINDNDEKNKFFSSLKNKLSARLKGNKLGDSVFPVKENMDENGRNFLEQPMSNLEKTIFKLDLLKKIQTELRNEISQSKRADERYDFIMKFLSENNYDCK